MNIACRPGPHFLAVGNNAYKQTLASSARSIDDCQKECVSDKTCKGIDWTQQQLPGMQCKLVGEAARKSGPSRGTTHYNIYRNYACTARK